MNWTNEAKKNFYLDNLPAKITEAQVAGNQIRLKLDAPSTAREITYLTGRDWDGKPGNLLRGKNGIAALTFCDVVIEVENKEK